MMFDCEFNPSAYPRSYATSLGWRLFWVTLSAGCAAFGIWGIWHFTSSPDAHKPVSWFSAAFFVLIVVLAPYMVLFIFKMNVTLTRGAVEAQTLFTRQRLLRSEIAGWRTGYTATGILIDWVIFIPLDPGTRKLSTPMFFKTDSAFDGWVRSLPKLEKER